MKRILPILCAVSLLLVCFPFTASAQEVQTMNFTQLHGYYAPLGRTVEHNNCLYMDNVASGFELYFYGSGDVVLNATVRSSSDLELAQYLSVTVDGSSSRVRVANSAIDTHEARAITLASGLQEGYHHIEVYRQTEAKISLFRAETLSFSGRLLATPPQKPLTIDVIGDSISAGYGCLWNTSLGVSDPGGNHPVYEDGTQTYAFLAGKALGANVRVTQTSGFGCVAGWNGTYPNLQDMYPYACWWRSTDFLYDFTPPADVVVINLGTNDYNTRTANDLTNDEFKAGALNLMKMAKQYNNNAPVVWCTGMMGTYYQEEVKAAIAELGGTEAGYYFLVLPNGQGGAVSHPTAAQQAAAGEVLAEFLRTTILPAEYTAAGTTAAALQSTVNTAKAVSSPSAALSGAIARAEAELSVATTDPYRLGARKADIEQAMAGTVKAVELRPVSGISKTPVAGDGVSFVWPYYEPSGALVTLYKGGEGTYWPQVNTEFIQTVDIDETPYLTIDFQSTAQFNLHLSYRAVDGNVYSVTASSLAGIGQTDFPAQARGKLTLDLGNYIRTNGHATEEGLISLLSCSLFAIGSTDQYVNLYTCAITNDGDSPTTITGEYTISDGILKDVAVGTTAAELIAAMDHRELLSVCDTQGNPANGTLATGMTLCLTVNGQIVDRAVIAVRGDLNGDGEAKSSDARIMLVDNLKSASALTPVAQAAGDLSGDGRITTTDVRTLLKLTIA